MLVIPILDIVQIYYQDIIKINGEMGKPYPLYVTFLSCYSQGHIFQMIYLCFLPLYLLVIVGEECIVDYITGYKNILICKMGKNKYILQKMKSAFIVSFTIVFVGLGLNLILSQVVFNGGTNTPFDAEPLKYDSFVMVETFLFEISYTHPLTTNIVYILITAIFAGVLGMMGAVLAISIHERKMVYALTFAIWFIPILFKNSSMHIFQPFMEYGFNVVVPVAIWCIVLYILVIITAIIWEKKLLKYKYLVCALIYVGLCSIDCYFSNVPMLNSIGQMGITEDVIFLNMHNSGSNFCGIKEILVVDTIPVLLGIYYALDKEKTYILLRYKTREKYNNSQIRIIIVMAAIFSAVRQIVDYIFTVYSFNGATIKKYPFVLYSLMEFVVIWIFFVATGLFYKILRDCLQNELIALIGAFGVNFVQFFLIKFWLVKFWIPGLDVAVAYDFLEGNKSPVSCLGILAKNIVMAIVLYIAGIVTFAKRDILRNEK